MSDALDEHLRNKPYQVWRDDDSEETLSEHDSRAEALVSAKKLARRDRVKVMHVPNGVDGRGLECVWWSHEVDDE